MNASSAISRARAVPTPASSSSPLRSRARVCSGGGLPVVPTSRRVVLPSSRSSSVATRAKASTGGDGDEVKPKKKAAPKKKSVIDEVQAIVGVKANAKGGQYQCRPQTYPERFHPGTHAAIQQNHTQRQIGDQEGQLEVVEFDTTRAVLPHHHAHDQEDQQHGHANAAGKRAENDADHQHQGANQGKCGIHQTPDQRGLPERRARAYIAVAIIMQAGVAQW